MKKTLPARELIDQAKQRNSWDFGNDILYKLCRENFYHKVDFITLAKVLFIGRIYAAAVERRKPKDNEIGDIFYCSKIEPVFRKPFLDNKLEELSQHKELTKDNIPLVLHTHYELLTELRAITNLEKRSFCSKYLHFHLPELFFIFDSRVQSALRGYIRKVPKDLSHILDDKDVDKDYATFFCKIFALKRQIEDHYQTTLTNRQMDNILIAEANKKAIMNKRKTQTE